MSSLGSKCAVVLACGLFGGYGWAMASDDTSARHARIPANIVPWENVTNRVDASEVVLLCLVNSFDVAKPAPGGPGDSSPAQMLDYYLSGVRSLGAEMGGGSEIDPRKISIFVVECGDSERIDPTRERAGKLYKQFGLPTYDRSIPVIFVFHDKKIVTTYTYYHDGNWGADLKTLVVNLLKHKDVKPDTKTSPDGAEAVDPEAAP